MVLLLIAALVSGAMALTATERQAVVDAHNNYRQLVASGSETNKNGAKLQPAADMSKIVYDTGIEAIAQKWAAGCKFQHSTSRNGIGENIYMSGGKQPPSVALKAAADLWWKEIKTVGLSDVNKLTLTNQEFNRGIGHWTQMAWAKTNRIGCGVQSCSSGTIVVCNYAPAGNYLNSLIYTAGKACSKCPSGTKCSNSLCA